MAARDYEVAPVTESLQLDKIITGLAGDLEALRAGKISVNDAIARSLLAKQIFNGVRLYLNGTKMLADQAREVQRLPETAE
ncbi:hypothetical protein MKK88_05640 [Methylobacterium sp. E-005]|uniref:hypothetical protein n=1 Tax=Methylobacterium sp. E-005 TaxID=2836549 RepID=UPI001FBA1C71|nr:hypothetical protein [Methylobacterium sp. E-005]MCJ2085477.1 hypothetical protein [Methylobacterium sp. E-005]